MEWNGKRVAVIGLGLSNTALIKYLARRGAHITACDKKTATELGSTYRDLRRLGVTFQLGDAYLEALERFDGLFLTPGMSKELPPIRAAEAAGIPVSSEMQLFFDRCPARIIGITGSSGKTTTTSLIGAILQAAGHTVHVGGNMGRPLIDRVERIRPTDWVVLELSSFQLDRLHRSPHIAVVTNVTPNHLQEHGSMDAYTAAKKEIFLQQSADDWLVLNEENPITRSFAAEAKARVRTFSMEATGRATVFVDERRVVIDRAESQPGTLEEVCSIDDVRLLGRHNLANVLTATAVADLCGVPLRTIREAVRNFTGVPHRLELVVEAGGVRYYNDSISTTPERAVAGIQSFDEPLILIAGGYEKGLPFDEMADAICQRVSRLVLIGQTAPTLRAAVEQAARSVGKGPAIVEATSLAAAVDWAVEAAGAGDVVLLSPGCSSYDMFENFIERGEAFRRLVLDHVGASVSPANERAE